jgi:general transcription factor 3C polypeptide 5 (transcription factor C subunit 1)
MRAELEKRPVMVRRVQANITGARGGDEKHCWAYLGYSFRGGPFKDALIKFGVDPRSDPRYREYQTITLHIPDSMHRNRLLRLSNRAKLKFAGLDTHIFDGNEWFDDGKVFQLCDVTDPLLRSIIENATVVKEFDVSEYHPMFSHLAYH